ncbi:MAG: hypothetical protein E6Q97_21285 [Desulfurellales bacterium]|nr:MAG: hypothetical protein E6Q97_21285 [Desulfurellales bacterium]
MSFAAQLEKHVARLGIAGALAAFKAAGEPITRRTLEGWRYGKAPRVVIQRGALAILADAASAAPKRTARAKRPAMPTSNEPVQPRKAGE